VIPGNNIFVIHFIVDVCEQSTVDMMQYLATKLQGNWLLVQVVHVNAHRCCSSLLYVNPFNVTLF